MPSLREAKQSIPPNAVIAKSLVIASGAKQSIPPNAVIARSRLRRRGNLGDVAISATWQSPVHSQNLSHRIGTVGGENLVEVGGNAVACEGTVAHHKVVRLLL